VFLFFLNYLKNGLTATAAGVLLVYIKMQVPMQRLHAFFTFFAIQAKNHPIGVVFSTVRFFYFDVVPFSLF
jgi:hypothetical protein